jgi:microcystin-dependent protein
MGTTSRLHLPWPTGSDLPEGETQIKALADKLDPAAPTPAAPSVAVCHIGTKANLPAAGMANRFYYATDEGNLYLDTGSSWITVPTLNAGRLPDILDMKFSAKRNEHGGWIYADGRSLAAGVYPNLRAALVADGNPFGVSGSNPLLPDMKGRVPMGAGAGAGLTARTFGGNGGSETQTLIIANLPSHSHGGVTGQDSPDHSHSWADPHGIMWEVGVNGGSQYNVNMSSAFTWTSGGANQRHTHPIPAEGSGTGHNNVQPFTICQWFVYAGPAT